MYQKHPVFVTPEDENIKIWRFMDFTKFVSMIGKKSLFFCNAEKIGDPFEGSFTKLSIEKMKNHPFFKNVNPKFFENQSQSRQLMKKFYYLNCWHMNDIESAAMWKLYLSNNEGVAIQSTFKKFANCFHDVKEGVYIGTVNYVDYDSVIIPDDNAFWPFVHKRKSFEHEKELRAIMMKLPPGADSDWLKAQEIPGLEIQVDLEALIEKIHISPTAPLWFKDVVKSTCEKFNLNKEIQDSKLSERPVY